MGNKEIFWSLVAITSKWSLLLVQRLVVLISHFQRFDLSKFPDETRSSLNFLIAPADKASCFMNFLWEMPLGENDFPFPHT